MAHQRKGQLTNSPQMWKHLRDWKRIFWGAERKAGKEEARKQTEEDNESSQPKED